MKKIIVFILLILILLSAGVFTYIFVANLSLKRAIRNLESRKESELKTMIDSERQLIRRGMEEKYRLNLDSFEAMSKRLKIEKEKAKKLEEELKKTAKEEPKN